MRLRRSHVLDGLQFFAVLAILVAALTLSALLRPPGVGTGPVSDATGKPPAVSLAPVRRMTHAAEIAFFGVVTARTMTGMAAEVSGRVVHVSDNFRPGASVAKGERLFALDPSDYRLGVERAFAEVETARADLIEIQTRADIASKEWTSLYPGRDISPLSALVPQTRAAKARLLAAEAVHKTAELALSRTEVFAPFDARVIDARIDIGQILAPGYIVGSVQALDSIEISASLSLAEIAAVAPIENRAVRASFRDRPGLHMTGRVARLDARLDERTRLAKIYIAMDDPSQLRVGEFADIFLNAEPVEALILPKSSLSGSDLVWVADAGVLRERRISILSHAPDLIVRPFDVADGVVIVIPFGARDGLAVTVAADDYAAIR